ncbi:ExeA family protein [Thiomicrorhabdus sp.]|uniref:ExeA family protein n=1 Tax=Thiomicrorhabdus sp. TaxID=2039724 RepID=UPI002AA8AC88|nr:AAA family ATPase [Thiomicrorhabdus sp.]
MYRKYFGLSSLPFKTTPDLDMFYKHGSRQEILEALIYTISRGDGIIKVTGEVGSGKTMLLRLLADRLPANFEVIYINSPNLSAKDILLYICSELGLEFDLNAQKFTLTNALKKQLLSLYSQDKKVVMLVDEAQTMTFDALEELRLLSNIETGDDKLLQMVLFGQPELDKALEHDDIRQLKSRISYNIYVPPLKGSDVQAYLNYRMRKAGYVGLDVFNLSISNKIQKLTHGLPRNINIVADKVLMSVFGSGDKFAKPKHLKALPELDDLTRVNPRFAIFPTVIITLLFFLLVLFGYFLFFESSSKHSVLPLDQVNNQKDDISSIIKKPTSIKKADVLPKHKGLNVDSVKQDQKDSESVVGNGEINVNNQDIATIKSQSSVVKPLKSSPHAKLDSGVTNLNIKNPNAIVGNPAQLMQILRYHKEGREWLDSLQDIYVIQLSTRHIRSLDTTLKFYQKQGIKDGSVHILIDYNKNIDKFRLKVFYLASSRFSALNKIIEELPYKIRASSPYIARIDQIKQNILYTDRKLEDIGIVNE